jgi:hypothetical protein
VSDETRRAPAAFVLTDGRGVTAQGDAEAVIGDDDLRVGPVTVAFLDADALRAADYRIEIDCWPSGRLTLTQLGRRFDTFAAELRRSRDTARVAGLLAHGIALPTVFEGAVLEGGTARAAACQVYPTHVTIVPADGDPWQLPLGALTAVERQDEPPAVVLQSRNGDRTSVGRLARKRDEFYHAVAEQRDAQAELLGAFTGSRSFADGLGVARGQVADFDGLARSWSAPTRAEGAAALIALARGAEPRIGLVQLLDPDAASVEAAAALPAHWASFLLVPTGAVTVLEILAGPGAATYVFDAPIEAVNQDLQALHFRRHALALQGSAAELTPQNPSRLALRKLEPLIRLRHAIRARIIHNDGWREGVRVALEAGKG